jgi:hypothetical protein
MQMEDTYKQVVNNMLNKEGGPLIKDIENRLRTRQDYQFYGSVLVAFAAGIVGGVIGSNWNK